MSKKRSEPSLDKYGTGTQTETERTKMKIAKKKITIIQFRLYQTAKN